MSNTAVDAFSAHRTRTNIRRPDPTAHQPEPSPEPTDSGDAFPPAA